MKLPDLSRLKPESKPGGAAKSRAQLKLPRAVEDVYRDMRDRRLLVPALLLVIAIVAVPIALGATREEPPAPQVVVDADGAEAVAPAVLTEEPVGVRDYRERLDELQSKNPFKAAFKAAPAEVADATEITEPTLPSSGSPSSGAPDPAPSGSSLPPSAPAPIAPTSSGGGDARPAPAPKTEIRVMEPRLDVVAGRAGKTREITNVKVADLLPSKDKAPIAMFMGISGNLKFAHFAVSDNVTDTRGDGNCTPRADDCEFLRLGLGKKRVFLYGPSAKRYSIKITDIREVVAERRKVASD